MKNTFIAICCIAGAFTGCKENDTPIVYPSVSTDSTYVLPAASIPAADPHNVLVEEFTGQSCSNCPGAHKALEDLAANGHVNIVGLYITDYSQTTPLSTSIYDFRDSVASVIGINIYGGISGIPSGGVDRVPVGSSILTFQGDWSSAIPARKLVVDSVNLAVESSYGSDGVATIKATITYLKPMSTQQNLSIVVVEDSMVDIQEEPYPINYDTFYVFTNVFRGMVTAAPLGESILGTMATKEAGRVYWRKYTYTPKVKHPAINPAHCRVIAFLNSPGGTTGDYHVLQSAKCNLIP
jgi:hypothetical protein